MNANHGNSINVIEGEIGDILVVTDFVTKGCWERGMVMTVPALRLFSEEAKRCGFDPERFVFVNIAPSVPAELRDAGDSKLNAFLAEHREEFLELIETYEDCSAILTLGKWGLRQLYGKSVQITKARGTLKDFKLGETLKPILPLLSPREVLKFPDKREIYNTDFLQLKALEDDDWSVQKFREASKGEGYEWCLDIQHLLDNPPICASVDCETGDADDLHDKEKFRLLTVSITPKKGTSYVVPLDIEWWNDATLFSDASAAAPRLTRRLREKLIRDLATLLSNPDVHVVGHNLKYDIHSLLNVGIEIANFYADTMQLAFAVDDNMQSKGQDDCVRRWVHQFAGYADQFNEDVDKGNMQFVEHKEFLEYAGGDTNTNYQLASVLLKLAKEDKRNWETFVKVQMPALRAFVTMERQGVRIDTTALADLEVTLGAKERELYEQLMTDIPAKVLREHEGKWNFNRADFIIDILFGPDGIRVRPDGEIDMENGKPLEPVLFTKETKKPSTSGKDHLPYFDHCPFVQRLMEYGKITKMRSTYVGTDAHDIRTPVKRLKAGGLPKAIREKLAEKEVDVPDSTAARRRKIIPALEELARAQAESLREGGGAAPVRELEWTTNLKPSTDLAVDPYGNVAKVDRVEATGFWQYLKGRDADSGKIHPSFLLHGTVTGRTSSRNPNAQNFPKRGPLAKAYRKIFVPTPGYVFIESDLSQAELRIAAWMANEREMIRIYESGGDIHAATAAATMGISEQKFNTHLHDQTPLIEVAKDWPGSGQYLTKFAPGKRREVTVEDFLGYKRFSAKAVNFGFLYGMGWKKFRVYARTDYGLVYSEEEAQEIRQAFFRKYPRLVLWHQKMREFVGEHGYVRSLHGALRRLPNIESDDDGIQGMSSRQAINSPVQRFGSDLGLMALSRFVRDIDLNLMRPVLFIHDANVIEAREDVAEEAAKALRYYMETTPLDAWFDGLTPPLPILADVAMGTNLCDMEERPDLEAEEPSWYRSGEEPPTMSPEASEVWRKKKRRNIILTG